MGIFVSDNCMCGECVIDTIVLRLTLVGVISHGRVDLLLVFVVYNVFFCCIVLYVAG